MRKVKFPLQFDAIDLVSEYSATSVPDEQTTDELRNKIQPINSSAREILKDRDDRARVAKREKVADLNNTEVALRGVEKDRILQLARENDSQETGVNPTAIYELYGASNTLQSPRLPISRQEWYRTKVLLRIQVNAVLTGRY